jgi:RNA polymerase sigma-70 factor (ECF subfamily)
MVLAPTTQLNLLVRLRNARDSAAWAQFVTLYAPVIYGYARKHGLQDADADDLSQEVFRAVACAVGTLDYDPRRGTFRGWLFTVARNLIRTFAIARKRRSRIVGALVAPDGLDAFPAPSDAQYRWEQEDEQRLFAWAAEQVRGTVQEATWQAFWQTAVEGKEAKQVAQDLGISVGALYVARSRVLARLKDRVRGLLQE